MDERTWFDGPLGPRAGKTACDGVEHPLCASCERRRLGQAMPETKVWVRPAISVVAGDCINHQHLDVRAIAATSAG